MADLEKDTLLSKQVSRRNVLKGAGIGGVGLLLGATGMGGVLSMADALPSSTLSKNINNHVSFYGKHQAGIATEVQNHIYFASLDVSTTNKEELISLFKDWTEAVDLMTQGKPIGVPAENLYLPPDDTGEAMGLDASNLTITFGVGRTIFIKEGQDRFGLSSKKPKDLEDLPKFPLDSLEEEWCGGDICIQACADDFQVAFHAVRNLVRMARGKASLKWAQAGFQRSKQAAGENETPRNLFGFKDGTVNPDVKSEKELNEQVWVLPSDGPDWLVNGSYLVVRRIQMFIEVWDRTTLKDQEATFGRHRDSGAPLGKKKEFDPIDLEQKDSDNNLSIPTTAHVRVAHGKGEEQILRRSYSYTEGMDLKRGTFDAGLLFISFQKSPTKQFVPIQQRLAMMDKLNEYIIHRGSAVFACLPGIKEGGYIGETLFE